jgi:uncharacterized membrane protein YeaQ/YmgE (transglycosylase-associated protein family)
MFLVFMLVALVAGALHQVFPGPHHLRASAFAVALAGSWFGGFCAAAFYQGTFTTMGWVTLAGSVLGAIVHLIAFELIAHAILHSERYTDPGW